MKIIPSAELIWMIEQIKREREWQKEKVDLINQIERTKKCLK